MFENNKFNWCGRVDPEDGPDAKRWHQVVSTEQSDPNFAHLIGFPCDMGVERNKGRLGAALAPDVIRKALCGFAWHGPEGHIWDRGNLDLVGLSLEDAHELLGNAVCESLKDEQPVLVLGGGHETAAGTFGGLLKSMDPTDLRKIGVINFDAHLDLRKPGDAGVSSGTPFFQIHDMLDKQGADLHYLCLGVAETSNTKALFDRADQWGVDYIFDYEMPVSALPDILDRVGYFVDHVDEIYLTVDLDVLPHWQMPGVSAPAALGVELMVFEKIVKFLGAQGKPWRVSDVVEYSPPFDANGYGARVAARLCDLILRQMVQVTSQTGS